MNRFWQIRVGPRGVTPSTVSLLLIGLLLAVLAPPAAAQSSADDVIISLDKFGVGSVVRPGEITGTRVELLANPGGTLGEATGAWVQWEVPNADGDIIGYGRHVTLTRGRPMYTWLYAPLPPGARSDTIWSIRVFETRDGERRGELGGMRFRPADAGAQFEEVTTGLIGVIGQRQMGLNQYSVRVAQGDRPRAAHEFTRTVFGIRPDELPDRWEALNGLEAIVWGDASPLQLTSDTANALRQYVRRGGHLVIVLPEDANPWQAGAVAQTPLEDLLPPEPPRRDEDVALSEILPLISKARGAVADFPISIRVFQDLEGGMDRLGSAYVPMKALEDGRVVVAQREYGHGRVTISGLDLTRQQIASVRLSNNTSGLPQADVFWNRILGRRVDTPSAAEYRAMEEEDLLARAIVNERTLGTGGLITQPIAMSTQAGVGLLVALVLFATYWIIAGPGGFAFLKMYKKPQHAWVAFGATALVFTAIAWGTVSVLRINEPLVRHVTYLDHVAQPVWRGLDEDEPQMQRAVSWLTLYTPGYQNVPLGIESAGNERNLLATWTAPGESVSRFPNANRYTIDIGTSGSSLLMPSRSTATQFYANWLGGLSGDWGGMIREHPDRPVNVQLDGSGREVGLEGVLLHDLPDTLRDVTFIWVRNQRFAARRYQTRDGEELMWMPRMISGQMNNLGYMLRLPAWNPGDQLVLEELESQFTGGAILSNSIDRRYVEDYRSTGFGAAPTQTLRATDRLRYKEMLSFFHQLTPPQYFKGRADDTDPDNVVFARTLGRELDLSPWFSRPCVIIIGHLENSELPIPLRVNEGNQTPASEGLTIVRWIYPLPVDPDIAFRSPDRDRTVRHEGTEATP